MSNSLHPDQADILSDLICVQAVFEGYQHPLRSKVTLVGGGGGGGGGGGKMTVSSANSLDQQSGKPGTIRESSRASGVC